MRKTLLIAWASIGVMMLSACGTRLGDEAFVAVDATEGSAAGAAAGEADGSAVATEGDVSFEGLGNDGTSAGTTAPSNSASAGSAGSTGGSSGSSTGTTSTTRTSADSSGGSSSGDSSGTSSGTSNQPSSGGGSEPVEEKDFSKNEASDVGVTPTTIKVGNMVDKGGALGPIQFTPTYYGANAYFQYLNATQGGIHGREVEYVTCDTKESKDESYRCAQRLIEEEKIFAFVANNLRNYASAEYVSDQGVPDVGGEPIGNEYYTYPTLFSILDHGYPRDGTVGFDGTLYWGTGMYHWFADNTGITKAGVFYYSIPISKQAGLRIVTSLEEAGVEVVEFEINPALPNFDSAVVTMQNEGVDAIFDTMDSNANRNMCDSMQRRNFTVKVKSTTVAGWTRRVRDEFSDVCRPAMYATGSMRPMSDMSHPEIKLFNDVMSRVYNGRFDESMHQWHLEGWIAAKLFAQEVEALGATPTRKGLIDRLNGLDQHPLDGLHGGLDWLVKDYENNPPPECTGINRWSEEAGDFVKVEENPFVCFDKGRRFPYSASA